MTHRHHIATAQEEVGLAKGEAPVDHLRRAGDHEERLTVLLELRPLMCFEGILDGKLMQAELGLELSQENEARLVEADPDHVSWAPGPLPGIFHGDLGHTATAEIGCCGDNAWVRRRLR